ncbi:unnamed protein product [[Candida] boidinii]|nr:unnamed protein product [[Candida] boidinii]
MMKMGEPHEESEDDDVLDEEEWLYLVGEISLTSFESNGSLIDFLETDLFLEDKFEFDLDNVPEFDLEIDLDLGIGIGIGGLFCLVEEASISFLGNDFDLDLSLEV